MDASELIFDTTRRYSSLLREVNIRGKTFSSKELAFVMQMQTQSNWCWAATATSVSHFYRHSSSWTQCRVANDELGRSDCCNSTVPSECNVPWFLDRALTRTDNFASFTMGPATFEQVRDEIDARRPVGARIGWSGGGGHFVVIYGYSFVGGTQYFDIDDPIYGKSHLSVSDFSGNYQGSGTWTHTYFTKKEHVRMPIKLLFPREPVLHRIQEVRPLLNLKQEMTGTSELQDAADEWPASLGMALRMYSLGLDSLTAESQPQPQPIGLRVHEMVDDAPRAFFDVSDDEDPYVQQISASENYLEPFARGLAEVFATTEQSDEEGELRLLRVPALNFEALWINYEGEGANLLVPLREVGRLSPYQTVPFDEAMDALREAARPLAQMDDMMGA